MYKCISTHLLVCTYIVSTKNFFGLFVCLVCFFLFVFFVFFSQSVLHVAHYSTLPTESLLLAGKTLVSSSDYSNQAAGFVFPFFLGLKLWEQFPSC